MTLLDVNCSEHTMLMSYRNNVTGTKINETKIPIKLKCQDGDSNPHLTMVWYMQAA